MSMEIQALTSSEGQTLATAEGIARVMLDEARFPKYRKTSPLRRIEWLSAEMKTLATIVRMKDFDANEAVASSIVLDEMVMQHRLMPDLTLAEMHAAFRNGVFGLYGGFFGLSAPNLYGFLNSYLISDKKVDANKIVRKQREAEYRARQQKEMEEEQKKIRAEIEQAKRDGTFVPNPQFSVQNFALPSPVAVPTDPEHRKRVLEQARKIKSGEIKIK